MATCSRPTSSIDQGARRALPVLPSQRIAQGRADRRRKGRSPPPVRAARRRLMSPSPSTAGWAPRSIWRPNSGRARRPTCARTSMRSAACFTRCWPATHFHLARSSTGSSASICRPPCPPQGRRTARRIIPGPGCLPGQATRRSFSRLRLPCWRLFRGFTNGDMARCAAGRGSGAEGPGNCTTRAQSVLR